MNPFTATMPPPLPSETLQPRSLGLKLILVCALALVMWLPSFFVNNLVQERSQGTAEVTQQNAPAVSGLPFRTVDSYRSVNRSLKYVLLFLGMVFATYFIFEATTGKRVHPAQYVLVGTAQLIFYLLLLSLAEKINFDLSFLIAGTATVALLSVNAGWIFAARAQQTRAFVVFTLLYTLIYLLLRVEQDALLIGAVSSFGVVSAVMYFTRGLDWYSSLPGLSTDASAAPPSMLARPHA